MKFSTTLTDFAKKIMEIKHPVEEDLGFLYGAILTDGKDDFDENKGTHNICVFADRQVSILFFTFNFQLDSVHTSFKINSVNFYLRLTCCEVQIVPKRRRNNFQAFRLDFFHSKVDRSPTGSGVTSRIAAQFAKKQIGLNQKRIFVNGKTGSKFTGEVSIFYYYNLF